MPIYEYACECGARVESLERMGTVRAECGELCVKAAATPEHGHGRVERAFSTGQIRGDGREAKEATFDPCARSNRPGGPCH